MMYNVLHVIYIIYSIYEKIMTFQKAGLWPPLVGRRVGTKWSRIPVFARGAGIARTLRPAHFPAPCVVGARSLSPDSATLRQEIALHPVLVEQNIGLFCRETSRATREIMCDSLLGCTNYGKLLNGGTFSPVCTPAAGAAPILLSAIP